ncbi:MAG: hypothetical protein QXH20_02730, partial [Candidatus Bathyarchaeia archaeon]
DLSGKLAFVFCSHGAMPFGIFFSMVPSLQKRGLTVIGWNNWYGSVYQVLHAVKPYFTDGHPDEIDLQEAEAFGREIAERAKRILAGEKELIPPIPKGKGAPTTFLPHPIGEPFPGAKPQRIVDTSLCKFPKCRICVETCPARAIVFEDNEVKFRKGCFNCSLCDRICPEGAIKLIPEEIKLIIRTQKIINMDKCKYPDCTLCIDHCPMDALDFSSLPPKIRYNCEGDDLCWVICPTGAIEITNLDHTHKMMYERMIKDKENHPFLKFLEQQEAQGKFRRLVSMTEIGWDNPIFGIQQTPRFVIPEDDC